MYSEDEKRSIRNEQQREAAPSPGQIEAEHRRLLAEEGCRECDEDDPDNLGRYFVDAGQGGFETVVLCDDHGDEVDV